MKTALKEIGRGQAFTYGGVQWLKLDDTTTDSGEAASLVLALESLFEGAFGEENKWAECSLREELNGEFLNALVAEGAEESAFVPMTIDLTAEDGLDDYGTTTDRIALISCNQYRKYRRLIPVIDSWWWTVTPFSCESNAHSCIARYVSSDGTLDSYNAYYGSYGVRPLCNLRSEILVSIEDAEDSAEPRSGEAQGQSIEARMIALEARCAAVEEKNVALEARIAALE